MVTKTCSEAVKNIISEDILVCLFLTFKTCNSEHATLWQKHKKIDESVFRTLSITCDWFFCWKPLTCFGKGSALDVSHDFGYTSLNHIKGILPNMENILLNIIKKLIQVLLPCWGDHQLICRYLLIIINPF